MIITFDKKNGLQINMAGMTQKEVMKTVLTKPEIFAHQIVASLEHQGVKHRQAVRTATQFSMQAQKGISPDAAPAIPHLHFSETIH